MAFAAGVPLLSPHVFALLKNSSAWRLILSETFTCGRAGRRGIKIGTASPLHPLAYHASATASRGWSHPSPFVDLSPQNLPNACRHTICVHSGHFAHILMLPSLPFP